LAIKKNSIKIEIRKALPLEESGINCNDGKLDASVHYVDSYFYQKPSNSTVRMCENYLWKLHQKTKKEGLFL
jgi:hypothetical protein